VLPTTPGEPAPTTTEEPAVTAAIARLTAEFSGDVPPRLGTRIVIGSRRDLDGQPLLAMPELVERLARERLRESVIARRT
jgi:hypothetical protein